MCVNSGDQGTRAHLLGFRPAFVGQVDLLTPLSRQLIFAGDGRANYTRARLLVRAGRSPIGVVECDAPMGMLDRTGLVSIIWQALAGELQRRFALDHQDIAALSRGASLHAADTAGIQSNAPKPPISVIICTRDRTDDLGSCLDSLIKLNYREVEIIVVDNAPRTTATEELVRESYAPSGRVRYVREDLPGLSRARNTGLREARSEIVAFTDDDVIVDRFWLDGIASAFEIANNVACVTGLVEPLELETPAQAWFEQFGGFGKGYERRIFDRGEHRPADPLFPYTAGKFGSGNNMAFRRSALRRLGGFDPALGAGTPSQGAEDLDAFFRVIMAGYALVYEPDAIVHHRHRRDYSALRRQVGAPGPGSYLAKWVIRDPWHLAAIAARLPSGLKYVLSSSSAKNSKRRPDYPTELARVERWGMIQGPVAYTRGWLLQRFPKTVVR